MGSDDAVPRGQYHSSVPRFIRSRRTENGARYVGYEILPAPAAGSVPIQPVERS